MQRNDAKNNNETSTSVSELKGKIFAATASKESNQRTGTQNELELLRARGRAKTSPVEPAEVKANQSASNRPTGSVAALRSALFANQATSASSQKAAIEADMAMLRANEGNVRNKAALLEAFFKKSNSVLETLKSNKISEKAKQELKVPAQLVAFEAQQNQYIEKLRGVLEADIRTYANTDATEKMPYSRFLQLAFTYRAYQVCLEQDFRRHVAKRIQQMNAEAHIADDAQIVMLCSKPTDLAIASMNYYEDFFKNLADIEKIWRDAGEVMRSLEVRLLFALMVFDNLNVLNGMLVEDGSQVYREACLAFDNEFVRYVANYAVLTSYIEHGDGLDIPNHPWTYWGVSRLPQSNASIDFSHVASVDEVLVESVHEVEKRVDADQSRVPETVQQASEDANNTGLSGYISSWFGRPGF